MSGALSPPALANRPVADMVPITVSQPISVVPIAPTSEATPLAPISVDLNGGELSTTGATVGTTTTAVTARQESTAAMEVILLSNSNSYSVGQQMEAWSRSRGEAVGEGENSLNTASDGDDRKVKRSRVDVEQSPGTTAYIRLTKIRQCYLFVITDHDPKGPKQKSLGSFFPVVPKAANEIRPTKTLAPPTRHSAATAPPSIDNSIAGGASVNELRRALDIVKEAKKASDRECEIKSRECEAIRDQKAAIEANINSLRKKLEETHRSMAKEAARRIRDRLAADSVRLGKFTVVRVGDSVGEAFEKGYAFYELQMQRDDIQKRKEELELRKQELSKLKRSFNKKKAAAQSSSSSVSALLDDETNDVEMDLDLVAEQCAIIMHTERLKKEETGLTEKEKQLDVERGRHEKELRRVLCEDKSKYYPELPVLGEGRYSLLRLLGQGGFSEVWLALDLNTLEEVAIKIHQLNSAWSTERQRAFIRHAKRELQIHECIHHPRIVRLVGCFDISNDAFATILEYCRGTDLDELLKKNRNGLTEKEAKPILLQILSGLRCFNPLVIGNERKTIIHFDLKPANILFDEMGDVKITDFGLSKVVDNESDGSSIDQTSHGAGTYWYLPPECFTKDKYKNEYP